MTHRRLFLGRAAASIPALSLAARPLATIAQERFPSRPLRLMVGFPPGGPLDVGARAVIEQVARALQTTAVVENKPGASGMLAAQQVATAAPDGHTLLMAATANVAIARFLYPKLPYDPDADLVPVAQFAVSQNVVYARRESGVSSLAGLVAQLRGAPGRFSYASPGSGTTPHLTMEMLKATERLFVVHVPYRGSVPAVAGVVAGDVELGVDAIGPVLAMARAGRIVPLAQTGERRTAALPTVPTLRELGYAQFPSGTFLGLAAPARTPAQAIAALAREVRRVVAEPDAARRLEEIALEPAFLDGPAFRDAIRAQLPFWKRAIEYSGATA